MRVTLSVTITDYYSRRVVSTEHGLDPDRPGSRSRGNKRVVESTNRNQNHTLGPILNGGSRSLRHVQSRGASSAQARRARYESGDGRVEAAIEDSSTATAGRCSQSRSPEGCAS
jgi:hypothetical protein